MYHVIISLIQHVYTEINIFAKSEENSRDPTETLAFTLELEHLGQHNHCSVNSPNPVSCELLLQNKLDPR